MPITKELLSRFYNPVFIETGTFMGAGVIAAIEVGFPEIYSIELSDIYYERNLPYFKDFPNVNLIHGNSGAILARLLEGIDSPVTFWLDAHYSAQGTAEGPSPLFDELKAIHNHHIKNHTILIDDIDSYCSRIEIVNNILICRQSNF